MEPGRNYISPSRLKLWLKCPLAYKLRYVDQIISPTPPNLFLGKMVHAGLEYFYRYRQRQVTLYADVVTEHIKSAWPLAVRQEGMVFTSAAEELSLKTKACELVATYLAQLRDDEPAPIAVEERFEAPLIDPRTGENLGTSLLGIVDLILDGAQGPIIIDFKTAARSSTKLDIIHELQLSCYSYLFRHAAKTKEQAIEIRSLIKTKTPKVETHRYSRREDGHFERLFAVIRAYLKSLREETFYIRPGLECSFCQHQQECSGSFTQLWKTAA